MCLTWPQLLQSWRLQLNWLSKYLNRKLTETREIITGTKKASTPPHTEIINNRSLTDLSVIPELQQGVLLCKVYPEDPRMANLAPPRPLLCTRFSRKRIQSLVASAERKLAWLGVLISIALIIPVTWTTIRVNLGTANNEAAATVLALHLMSKPLSKREHYVWQWPGWRIGIRLPWTITPVNQKGPW